MRPFPRGHKGLTLVANGKLEPAGEAYLNMVVANGTSAKPGDRVVITDVKFDHYKIDLPAQRRPGPQASLSPPHLHRRRPELRHAPWCRTTATSQRARASRSTSEAIFPQLTGAQVKALLAPLISFDVKTPIQAFTDTLPPQLKDAILNHHVMVGMSTDMVLFAKGPPQSKSREMDGQMPFEEWIYGKPPEEVDFRPHQWQPGHSRRNCQNGRAAGHLHRGRSVRA